MRFTFCILTCCLGLLISHSLVAKKYYKHVDENGITHYSDKPPTEDVEYESWQVRPEDTEYEVKVINRGTKQAPMFYAVNPYHGPVELSIRFNSKHNVKSEPAWPKTYVLPPTSDEYLAVVKPIDKNKGWTFEYLVESTLGDPNAVHDDSHVYALPFTDNKSFYISQSFNGQFSHFDAQNQYAVDIAMPEGSDVLAARSGIVMDIAEDFYDGGTDRKNLHRGNYIRILHHDGSMAIYAHLKLESVTIGRGQRVQAQQKIAESGNTGFSSGPHLHFAVQVNEGLHLRSVPFRFRHKNGQVKQPKVGPI